MPNPFDVTLKQLVEMQPSAWLDFAGQPASQVEVIDADLSMLTAEADKVLKSLLPEPFLLHLEFQAAYDPNMGRRMLRYNVLLDYRHDLPVQSVVILLRREADGPALTGRVERQHTDGRRYLDFGYTVIRLWQKPVQEVLSGQLSALPLAPLADVAKEELTGVVQRMEERIEQETSQEEAGLLWTATYLLMGLKYDPGFTRQLLKGVRTMNESSTYRELMAEGEERGGIKEARKILLRQGAKRFGLPDAQTQAAIEAISSLERLEQLAERLLEVENWQELLA